MLTDAQEQHINEIHEKFTVDLFKKYEKGASEHKTYLPDVRNLIQEIRNEAIDLVTYTYTLEDQLRSGEFYEKYQ